MTKSFLEVFTKLSNQDCTARLFLTFAIGLDITVQMKSCHQKIFKEKNSFNFMFGPLNNFVKDRLLS